MKRRQAARRAVLVPLVAGVGFFLVGYGQRLALAQASVPRPAATVGVLPVGTGASQGDSTAGSPEFGARQSASPVPPDRILSTTPTKLMFEARENSGREDPFVALTMPEAHIIVPLPPPMPKEAYVPPPMPSQPMQLVKVKGKWISVPVIEHPEPQWTVQGIINTGRDQMVLLVDPNGNEIQAQVGQALPDGSRVVSITARHVTLLLGGERYTKTIGGQDSP